MEKDIMADIKKYQKAEKLCKECLKASNKVDDHKLKGAILTDLGNIFLETERFNKAINYLNNSLKFYEKAPIDVWQSKIHILLSLKRYHDALVTTEKSIKIYGWEPGFWNLQLSRFFSLSSLEPNGRHTGSVLRSDGTISD